MYITVFLGAAARSKICSKTRKEDALIPFYGLSADLMDMPNASREALQRLMDGNKKYVESDHYEHDVSSSIRSDLWKNGQSPYACVIACADSRVVPESIFSVGLGELFVIRVAGNVIGDFELGSIEYAVNHLGTPLVLVLGHTNCGAVTAAINHNSESHIEEITREILSVIGDEKDDYKASKINTLHSVDRIQKEGSFADTVKENVSVLGAMYHLDSGKVEFFESAE